MTDSAGSTASLRWLTISSIGSWSTHGSTRTRRWMRPTIGFSRPASSTSSPRWAAGLPQNYTGRPMKDSHQDLMITAGEWEAFIDDLQRTLDKFGVPTAEQTELKTIVASTRADIVV